MATKKFDLDNLSCAAVQMTPVDFDWTEGYGETWESFEATRCEKCGAILICSSGGDKHKDIDCDSNCDGWVNETSGPMMSYYYPCVVYNVEEAAQKLVDTCLCVVKVGDQTALALTGGGMDLSWEICEVFMLLGFLPPLHFADLPGMSGRGTSARDKRIVAACLKTCEVSANWARSTADRIKRMVKDAQHRERLQRAEARAKKAEASPLGTPVYFKAKVAKKPSKK
jgi:hypothetical protein